ncbi:MAG: hypothetical protein ABEK50_18885 [bacterium]
MIVTPPEFKERAREALPFFQDARGDTGDPAVGSDESDLSRPDFPDWVLKLEEAARSETDSEFNDKLFFGLVAETLLDVDEYGEHRWEEDQISTAEMVDEIASDVSVSAYNEELVEWAYQSPRWSDVADELRDLDADDGQMELELIQEAMGDEIYRIRYSVLNTLHELLLEGKERGETSTAPGA